MICDFLYIHAQDTQKTIKFFGGPSNFSQNNKNKLQKLLLLLQIDSKINIDEIKCWGSNSLFCCTLQYTQVSKPKYVSFSFTKQFLEDYSDFTTISNLKDLKKYFQQSMFDKMPLSITLGSLEVQGSSMIFKSFVLKDNPHFVIVDEESHNLWKKDDLQWIQDLATQLGFLSISSINLKKSEIEINAYNDTKSGDVAYRIGLSKDFFAQKSNFTEISVVDNWINSVNPYSNIAYYGSLSINNSQIVFKSSMEQEKDPIIILGFEDEIQDKKNILEFVNGLYLKLANKPEAMLLEKQVDQFDIIICRSKQWSPLLFTHLPLLEWKNFDFSVCQKQEIEKILSSKEIPTLISEGENLMLTSSDQPQKALLCKAQSNGSGFNWTTKIPIIAGVLVMLGGLLFYLNSKTKNVDETTEAGENNR